MGVWVEEVCVGVVVMEMEEVNQYKIEIINCFSDT